MGAIATDVWEERWREGERGGGVAVAVRGGGGPCCCISMGAVQIPRDYWREKRGERKNDARFPGSVLKG